jgi:anti-anti-sigma factor
MDLDSDPSGRCGHPSRQPRAAQEPGAPQRPPSAVRREHPPVARREHPSARSSASAQERLGESSNFGPERLGRGPRTDRLELEPFKVDVMIQSRILAVRGDLDVATSPQLAAALETLLDRDGSTVTIDMAAVSFIDSNALGVLVNASNRLATTGGRILIIEPSPATARLLELTGLSAWFSGTQPDPAS